MKFVFRTFLTALVCVVAASALNAGVVVNLMDEAALDSDYVRLGSVANFKGDSQTASRISRVFLGPVPRSGVRNISRDDIYRRLSEIGMATGIRFKGAEAVKVMRRGGSSAVSANVKSEKPSISAAPVAMVADAENSVTTSSTEDAIKKVVSDYLREQMRRNDVGAQVTVYSTEGKVAGRAEELSITRVISGTLPGSAKVRVSRTDTGGAELSSFIADIRVKATMPVMVLRRAIRSGEVVRKQDVMIEHRTLSRSMNYMQADPKLVDGLSATRSISAMQALRSGDLKVPPVVSKGKVVVVDTVAGGFRIRHYARAMGDANLGEMVMVENTDKKWKKRYMAKATGPNRVEVMQGGGN